MNTAQPGVILSSRPQPRPPASRRLCQRRGSHHQKGAGRCQEIRARFQAGPGHRHWRGHHRQHAAARGCTPAAAGLQQEIRQKSRRRWPGCGRTTPAWPKPRKSPLSRAKIRPQYLAKCGGVYCSEWFWSKILHCLRTGPDVFDAANSWVELADYVPAALTGTEAPATLTVGICAAGHKAMFNENWGGYPDVEFLSQLDPELGALRTRLCPRVRAIDRRRRFDGWPGRRKPVCRAVFPSPSARLTRIWAPSAAGSLRARWSKSSAPAPATSAVRSARKLADIPGLCGIVNGSVLPGFYGLEAGQSAVGDIFNWCVNYIQPGGKKAALPRRSGPRRPPK